jgi:hypothetical protein
LLGVSFAKVVPMDDESVLTKHPPKADRTVEIPAPKQEYNIKRRGARVRLQAGTRARLGIWDVILIDLSRSGALVEHSNRVRVGETYQLSFQLESLRVSIKALAVRSFVNDQPTAQRADRQLLYRTGLEFSDLTPVVAEQISKHLERLRSSEFSR